MNLIQYLVAFNAVALPAVVGSADVAQCNGRPPLWVSTFLCADTATELSKCSDSHILSADKYEMFDGAWTRDDDEANSMLTTFVTWASLTRDVEMQEDLCEVSNHENMPWDIQMCDGDLKLVHRTQPILRHREYNFDPHHNPAMTGKDAKTKSQFGLPSEKVRKFMSLLGPHATRWHKIPAESYV